MASRNQRRNKRNKQNRSTSAHRDANRSLDVDARPARPRSGVETRPSRRTTELAVYAAAVIAVVMTALAVDDDGQGGGGDPFGAEHALRLITFLTIGYMIARGLAKAGSRQDDGLREGGYDAIADADGREDDPRDDAPRREVDSDDRDERDRNDDRDGSDDRADRDEDHRDRDVVTTGTGPTHEGSGRA